MKLLHIFIYTFLLILSWAFNALVFELVIDPPIAWQGKVLKVSIISPEGVVWYNSPGLSMKFKIKNSKFKTKTENLKVERIIDVNINRAVEGLRVMEEIVRFVLENKRMTKELKEIRGKLRRTSKKLIESAGGQHFQQRDVAGDVGKELYTLNEAKRHGLLDIFTANAKRVQEALRVLEEFAKLIEPRIGKFFKTLRFRLYEIEKRTFNKLSRKS